MAKLTTRQQIMADVDDGIYNLTKSIQKRRRLSWTKARDMTNHSLRVLMKRE